MCATINPSKSRRYLIYSSRTINSKLPETPTKKKQSTSKERAKIYEKEISRAIFENDMNNLYRRSQRAPSSSPPSSSPSSHRIASVSSRCVGERGESAQHSALLLWHIHSHTSRRTNERRRKHAKTKSSSSQPLVCGCVRARSVVLYLCYTTTTTSNRAPPPPCTLTHTKRRRQAPRERENEQAMCVFRARHRVSDVVVVVGWV